MNMVHKYSLTVEGTPITLVVQPGAKVQALLNQYEQPTLWVLCDPDLPKTEVWVIHCFGTGHPIPDAVVGWTNLGTVPFAEGRFIGHFYLERK